MFFARLIYYPFFETIFGTTPGKIFTETRVITANGNKPTFINILGRTFARFIPFEPFSFFGKLGWHDGLSNTQVVCETRTGTKARWYFLIFPAIVAIILSIYFGNEFYEDYKYNNFLKKQHEAKVISIKNKLKNLTTYDIIKIKDASEHYSSSDVIYLKIEEIQPDKLIVTEIYKKNDYNDNLLQIERLYNNYKDITIRDTIKISDLEKAIPANYKPSYKNPETSGAYFFKTQKKYIIESIHEFYAPCITNDHTGGYGPGIYINFKNCGWPAKIIAIENIENNITWDEKLPLEVPALEKNCNQFSISASEYKRDSYYKFKLTLQDSLNRKQVLLFEGKNLTNTMTRLE